jgi:hypothetical protein
MPDHPSLLRSLKSVIHEIGVDACRGWSARAVIGPFLEAWKARHPSVSGHQGRYELREIVNAIFYQNRTGCQWAYLPHTCQRSPQRTTTSRRGATTAPIR